MAVLKMLIVAVMLVVLSQPVTAEASTINQATMEPSQTKIMAVTGAKIQVGDRDSQIRFWRTSNVRDKQMTVTGLATLIIIGTLAAWARRRFY